MIILATSKDDKGKQLELLTKHLLRDIGYRKCTTNVMANGAEIDVRGELRLPGLGDERTQRLICECKAHKAVMDMTQWCKFLGKVFHQELCEQTEVAGCFISLSGVNGHVQGNFDELHRHRKSIMLVHGDDLLDIARKSIPLISLGEVSKRTASITHRTPSRFETAYHNGDLYWVVVFSEGEFTLLDANGKTLTTGLSEQLAPMVESELDVASYIDLEKEAIANQRRELGRVLVVATLFNSGGTVESVDSFPQNEDFSSLELQDAAQGLIDEGHLVVDEAGRCVVPFVSTPFGQTVSIELYRTLFGTTFPTVVLSSEFYQQNINRGMLKAILDVQGHLVLPDEDIDEILNLLKLSPTALAQSLFPMQMIVTGREQYDKNEQVDRFHQDYFKQVSLEALKRDFRNPALAEFFHDKNGFKELAATTKIVLKDMERIVSEAQFTERIGIGRAVESLGGGLVHVAMLADAPQPWDVQRDGNTEHTAETPATTGEAESPNNETKLNGE